MEEFVALQEILVLLVPDENFNEVFESARLTDLRMLLSSVAGRIELVTDSPGLQLTPQEARQLREQIVDRRSRVEGAEPPPDAGPPPEVASLREKLAEMRQSVDLR